MNIFIFISNLIFCILNCYYATDKDNNVAFVNLMAAILTGYVTITYFETFIDKIFNGK